MTYLSSILFFILLFSAMLKADTNCIYLGDSLNSYNPCFESTNEENKWLQSRSLRKTNEDQYSLSKSIKTSLRKETSKHSYSFQLENIDHKKDKKLSTNILKNSSRFASLSLKKSNIALKWAQVKYRYKLTKNFSVGTDLNAIESKVYMGSNQDEDIIEKKRVFIPSFALEAKKRLDDHLELLAKISSTITDSSSTYFYQYAGFSYKIPFKKNTKLHFGYQEKDLKIVTDTIKESLNYDGFYAGIGFRF